MEFQLLGPIEARKDGQRLSLGGPRQQALLAYLLLHREPVSAERLVHELWHEAEAPANGSGTVHTAVSRLRATLGARIVRSSGGYVVVVGPDELDLDLFRSLLAAAGAAEDADERSQLLRRADALWVGRPLDGLDVPFAASEARGLEELRFGAIEDRIEVDLARGEHAALLPELVTRVAAEPLRERLQVQLILALYRSGRQADALEAYRACRRTLHEELGLEPGPALKELEGAILRHDPSLERSAPLRPQALPPSQHETPRRRVARAFVPVLVAAGVAAAVAFAAVHELRAPAATTVAAPTVPVFRSQTPKPPRVVRPKSHHRTASSLVTHHVVTTTTAVVVVTHSATPTAPKPAMTTVSQPMRTTTTTAPPRPKPKPIPKPVPRTKPSTTPTSRKVTIADTFGGNAIDPARWSQSRSGSGWEMAEANGHLEFSFPASAVPGGAQDNFGGNIETLCTFSGDFDARVDYALRNWPPGNGVIVTLFSFLGPQSTFFQSSRISHADPIGEQYTSYTGWWSSFSGDDTSGTLRVARKDGVVTTYYRRGDAWETMSAARDTEKAKIAVGALASSSAGFGGQTITVDFSNFSVTGTNPAC